MRYKIFTGKPDEVEEKLNDFIASCPRIPNSTGYVQEPYVCGFTSTTANFCAVIIAYMP